MTSTSIAAQLVAAAADLAASSDLGFPDALKALTETARQLDADRVRFEAHDTDVYTPPADVYEAMVNVAREVGPVRKDRTADAGKGGTYLFRGIDGVMNAVHASMARNGVLPVPHDDPNPGGDGPQVREVMVSTRGGNPWQHHTVTTRWVLLGPNGSSLEVPIVSEALDNQDKGLGKARSYGLKDLLLRMLTLPTDDPDSDTEATRIPDAEQRYDRQGRPAGPSRPRGRRKPGGRSDGPSEAEIAAQADADAQAAGFEDEAHRLECHNEVTKLRRQLPDPYRDQARTQHRASYDARWPLTAVELADFAEFIEGLLLAADEDPTVTPAAPPPEPATIDADPDTDVGMQQDGGS